MIAKVGGVDQIVSKIGFGFNIWAHEFFFFNESVISWISFIGHCRK